MEKIKSFTHPYCEPCASCKAKLQAAEEMANTIKHLINRSGYFSLTTGEIKILLECVLAAWEKAGKGEIMEELICPGCEAGKHENHTPTYQVHVFSNDPHTEGPFPCECVQCKDKAGKGR